jgi:hypothetical protein
MRRIVVVSIGLLLLVGCGSKNTKGAVTGTVTYKGQPVNGAMLTLYPGRFPIPVTQDGKFSTTDVPPGDYKVVVEGTKGSEGPPTKDMSPEKLAQVREKLEAMKTPATIKFPEKYTSEATTTLTMKVGTGQQNITLELTD